LELRIELIDPADRRSAGGRILAAAAPEEVAAVEESHTGRHLRGRIDAGGTAARAARDKAGKGRMRAKRPLA